MSSFFDHESFVRRLKQVRDSLNLTGASMARTAGITKQTFSGYLNSGRLPGADVLERWISELGLDANWLLTGEGNMLRQARPDTAASTFSDCGEAAPGGERAGRTETSGSMQSMEGGFWVKATQINRPLPLFGLAERGQGGWCAATARVAAISPPVLGSDWLAVLVSGTTLLPHGLREGYVVFCDPAQPAVPDEAVFVRRTNGEASLKIFAGQRLDGWIELAGWLEPDAHGEQESFTERLAPDDIQCMAPVIYIRQRL